MTAQKQEGKVHTIMKVSIRRSLPFPKSVVWKEISQIERHSLWMTDAERIEFLSTKKTGAEVEFDCLTKVGPITVKNRMKVTNWDEPNSISVIHKSIFKGEGILSLRHLSPEYCEIQWNEQVTFPPMFLGPLGERIAKPVLERIWKKDLEQLESLLTTSE